MEFWGVEVKAGQPLKVKPEDEEIIHISQATLGESDKKGAESVPIYVKFGDRKLVLGTLSANKFPQISYDLVFEKEFELSHNWKGGSVYFMGYKTSVSEEYPFNQLYLETDSEEEDTLPINLEDNGKVVTEPLNVKKGLGNAKAVKVKSEEKPKADAGIAQGKIDSDSDDDDESAEDDSDDEKDGASSDDDSDDEDDDEDDSDEDDEEETPKKDDVGKKRPIVSAKTPESKKAKLTTPRKTDGKKGVQTATPHPAKQGSMNPASDKKNQQTQKSGGSVSCGSCSKTFNSQTGLQSHNKAKHGAK
ncbi:hypothetical protein SAY87_001862 [Trapa incisa]|uniref:C2H2-type domain-containing protein n=1 Tax=Trapa incisa TaxID=236973 RepID=A0AAN7JYR7_9MYRT|nr:hypothetical protein SAY87_001862 [Trapa incisa]